MTEHKALDATLERLQSNGDNTKLSGALISGRNRDYLAKGSHGEPIVLVRVPTSEMARPPVVLRHISVHYGVHCRIQEPEIGLIEGEFVVITCAPDDPSLFDLFIPAVEIVIETLPLDPAVKEVEAGLKNLIEMFHKLTRPGARALKGLWGELFIIANAPNPKAWLGAWRLAGFDKFDFAFPNANLDAKTSELPRRIHEYSLEQLQSVDHKPAYIVSILLRRSASGIGVCELVQRISTCVKEHALVERLWKNVYEALGSEFTNVMDLRFDESFALENLRILDAKDLPSPNVSDSRIFNVRFQIDITEEAEHGETSLKAIQIS